MQGKEFAGNQEEHQNFDPSALSYKFGLLFMGMKQIFLFFFKKKRKKKSKWPTLKTEIFKTANFQKFSWKFQGLVLGLVGLINAEGIDVVQPIWLWGCLSNICSKTAKKHKKCVLAWFNAYVGQPDNHIDWVISMSFATIYQPKDQSIKCSQRTIENWGN